MATTTELKIDDRYGILKPFREWVLSLMHDPDNCEYRKGYKTALYQSLKKLEEINKEAQRIADANRGEHA